MDAPLPESTAEVPAETTAFGTLRAYAQLGKLRLSALAVFAVIAGMYLGAAKTPDLGVIIGCTLGTMLVAIAGNALNMYLEREPDRRMRRTQERPLPTGRLSPPQVLTFGVITACVGLTCLWTETNPLATALAAAIFATYVAVYTPLKRVTSLNTLVGAIPGALPPVVGYAAGRGHLDQQVVPLFFIMFFWQIPHFLAIAWRYREDYRRGGMRMLPVIDPHGHVTSRQMVVYTVALIAASVFAHTVGLAGQLYLVAALLLGVLFLVPVVLAAVLRVESAMRLCFFVSIVYLPLLLGVMVLDRGTA